MNRLIVFFNLDRFFFLLFFFFLFLFLLLFLLLLLSTRSILDLLGLVPFERQGFTELRVPRLDIAYLECYGFIGENCLYRVI